MPALKRPLPCVWPHGPRLLLEVAGWLLWGPRTPVKHRCVGWGRETQCGLAGYNFMGSGVFIPKSDPGARGIGAGTCCQFLSC